ncbi:MAG: DUF3667 domain-containing protein [Kordiimonadaceae bacterium]|nr:DUF3667 domain-containing protein [Kordiimonadaceae bacterium]
MLAIFRKSSVALKRRRLRNERAVIAQYKGIELNAKGIGQECYNCKMPLTGPFCHICGQKDSELRRPIWTFFQDLLDAIFGAKSKIFQTIFLLVFVPGSLTRAFMQGQRARFLPPLRLYVVLSFAFFITVALADVLILDIEVTPKAGTLVTRMEAAERALAASEEQLKTINEAMPGLVPGSLDLSNAMEAIADLDLEERGVDIPKILELSPSAVAALNGGLNADEGVKPGRGERESSGETINEKRSEKRKNRIRFSDILKEFQEAKDSDNEDAFEDAQERMRGLLEDEDMDLSFFQKKALERIVAVDPERLKKSKKSSGAVSFTGDEEFPYDLEFSMFMPNSHQEREGILKEDFDRYLADPDTPEFVKEAVTGFADALKNPKEFNELFNDWLPWAMVILMPVFALILRIFHWGDKRYYFNQLVFAIHFHSFLFVFFTVFALTARYLPSGEVFSTFWIAVSVYLVIALKVGQSQSWMRAVLKAGFIWVAYFMIMMITMTGVMFYGLRGL